MTISSAILVFEGVLIIDYTGPYEALGRRGPTYLVGEHADPIATNMGMQVIPNYAFGHEPTPDVLVIPGGGSSGEPGARRYGVGAQLDNDTLIDWIRSVAGASTHVLSVCNGAFLAQRAGLLDGLTATTTAGYIDYLATVAPATRVVRDQRVVDNGKVVVTGGLSAGIDGALHIIQKLEGFGTAVETALQMEYDWRPADGWSRAALADLRVPQGLYHTFYDDSTRLLEFEAGVDRSREVYGASRQPAADLVHRIDAVWEDEGWTKVPHGAGGSAAIGTADDGTSWQVAVDVAALEEESAANGQAQRVTVEVQRVAAAS